MNIIIIKPSLSYGFIDSHWIYALEILLFLIDEGRVKYTWRHCVESPLAIWLTEAVDRIDPSLDIIWQ